MKSLFALALLSAFAVGAPSAQASDITYNLDINYSNVSAVGTITTDGTIGSLSAGNVVDFSVVITEGSNNVDVTKAAANFEINGGTTATASGLFFDFTSGSYFVLQAPVGNATVNRGYLCLQAPSGNCDINGEGNAVGNISIQVPFGDDRGVFENMSGVQEFASVGAVATPEPGSLALLGTGVLGFAGVLRRRWNS